MSTRLSQTIESLHEMQSVDLRGADIDDDGVNLLANALKENTTVTKIDLREITIGDEGASVLAQTLKVNTSVT